MKLTQRLLGALLLVWSLSFYSAPVMAQTAQPHADCNVVVYQADGVPMPLTMTPGGLLCVKTFGGSGSSGGTATAADPTYIEGATVQPFSFDLTGYQRVKAKQSGSWTMGIGPGSAIMGKVSEVDSGGADATDTANHSVKVTLAASTITQPVSGNDAPVSVTPTIQNAAYASGNCMGGFQAVSLARISSGSGILNWLNVISKGGGTTALQIYVFSQNPSGSTCTDKSTFTIVAADMPKLLTTFSLTPSAVTGSTWTEAENNVLAKSFATSGNANVYVGIVSGGNWTPASTTDLIVILGASQN